MENSNLILSELSVEEKAALVTGNGSWKTKDLGGRIPFATMSDGPHGLRKQEEEEYADINKSNVATCFPTGSALASAWSDECVSKVAESIAREAKAEKVSVVLGPAINIKRSPLCGRNFEYYSEDPYLAGHLATSYVNAMQRNGVGTSLKHFAVNNQETHRQTSNSMIEERPLHEIYLRAFEMCIKNAKPATVMASYNRINGSYACANKWLLKDMLREKWGYEGTVISDWGAAVRITDCIKNGMGLEMPDSNGYHTKEILEALQNGSLTERSLNEATKQVIDMARNYPTPETAVPCDYKKHHEVAREVAAEAAVLLKHTDALPLQAKDKILIIGEMAEHNRFQGGGSSHITTLPCKSSLEALKDCGFDITYASDISALAKLEVSLSQFDKILYFCGLTDSLESEGYDREGLELPMEQQSTVEYLTLNHRAVILVTFGGAPFIVPHLDEVSEVLHMHLGGQAVGEACAELLAGKKAPSGKLAETWPLALSDLPNADYYATGSNNVPYVENIFVGYRYFDTYGVPVQFPFGHGCSYTNFVYSNLHIINHGKGSENRKGNDDCETTKIEVVYDITNAGTVTASEVSQIYVLPKNSGTFPREAKRLAGYHKDEIIPGETKRVRVILDDRAFCVYDTKEQSFVEIAGDYELAVGASSVDLKLQDSVTIPGHNHKLPEILVERATGKLSLSFSDFLTRYEAEANAPSWNGLEQMPNFDKFKKGEYTKYDSMEVICRASWLGRRILNLLMKLVPMITKAPKDDPASKMIVCAMCEAPLDSLLSVSGGAVKPNLVESLVLHANGHPLKGIGRLLKGN